MISNKMVVSLKNKVLVFKAISPPPLPALSFFTLCSAVSEGDLIVMQVGDVWFHGVCIYLIQ